MRRRAACRLVCRLAGLLLAAPVLAADGPPPSAGAGKAPAAASSAAAGPAAAASGPGGLLVPLEAEGEQPPPPWHFAGLPDAAKARTAFTLAALQGQRALRVDSPMSYGNLVHPLQPPLPAQGLQLAWRWRLDRPLPEADLHRRAGDDAAIKICLGFELPIEAVPFVERQLLRLARLRTREPLPSATLCYVWDSRLPPGAALPNAFTRRVRLLVLHGPEAPLAQWQAERRDIAADFLRLFGDEVAQVPPLSAVAVGADADNTQGHGLAWVQRLQLEPAGPR